MNMSDYLDFNFGDVLQVSRNVLDRIPRPFPPLSNQIELIVARPLCFGSLTGRLVGSDVALQPV